MCIPVVPVPSMCFRTDRSCERVIPGSKLLRSMMVAQTAPPVLCFPARLMSSTASELLAAADIALIKRMTLGDESAVGPLYDRYGTVLYALAYRIVGVQADAEEVVAEAFAQVWREASRFEAGRGSAGAWLATIARSRALDLVRARSRR